MNGVFFDTSALVKRYYREPGTDPVDLPIEDPETQVVITTLSVVEIASAFRRKYNRNETGMERVDTLLAAFFEEALDDFLLVPLEEVSLEHALSLVLEDDLRTLDSIQLAAAIDIKPDLPEFRFATADRDFAVVAEDRGLKTFVPDTED